MALFYQLLLNNTLAGTLNFIIWFAITFFVYLQTRSVMATSIIGGLYLVMTASTGIWFGSLVDHHRKKNVMISSSIVSVIAYSIAFAIYIFVGPDYFKHFNQPIFWVFVLSLMVGVVVGNLRNIALPTLVTLLVPADNRDKANGLVGTAGGLSFMVTSIISGLLVGYSGMYWVLILAVSVTVLLIIHLLTIHIDEKKLIHLHQQGTGEATTHSEDKSKIDLKGTFKIVSAIPGLLALILFTTFNNFLGGVFMSLMDAYGLSMVSVQVWGMIWGFLSTAFIIGGLVIAKRGLGKNPLKSLFLANTVIWLICCFFTIYPSIYPMVVGMFIYLCVVPFIEASEQTILQKVVPLNRQGRVFGFAQSIEQSASPLTAFMIGPIAQYIFIPFMTTGMGVQLIGSWFGVGDSRGIALVFTITGFIGLAVTLIAFSSKYYRLLSNRYLEN
mgnify:CR=1 FL=1